MALRADGKYWVIDGQHRVMAALLRDDIIDLPCVLFDIDDITAEAMGFWSANSNRRNVSSLDKYRALIVAKDPLVLRIDKLLKDHSIKVQISPAPLTFRATSWAIKSAAEDWVSFTKTIYLITRLFTESAIHVNVCVGLYWIEHFSDLNIADSRFERRIIQCGALALTESIRKAILLRTFSNRTCADGILMEMNRGLRNPFKISAEEVTAKVE